MIRRSVFATSCVLLALPGCSKKSQPANTVYARTERVAAIEPEDLTYTCPMDPDIRSSKPGKCPRCGMTLKPGIPEQAEYPVDLSLMPRAVSPGKKTQLMFVIGDPRTGQPVRQFQIIHEKLFHLFVVGEDLKFFVHDHPVFLKNGSFEYDLTFPQPGMYRLLCDFYPDGGAPQLIAKTVVVPGAPPPPAVFTPEIVTRTTENTKVRLATDPRQPIAGEKTVLYLYLDPAAGLQQYLGAWAHMLIASADLIDTIHTHPSAADGGEQILFEVIFPRAGNHRIWIQFQRKGVVNTAAFDVQVAGSNAIEASGGRP